MSLANLNLSAHLYKIIPFFRTTNYFSSAHKIKWSEHSVGCDTLHVFFINPLVKIWSIGDAGVVNLVLIVEINARMILYNFCELVTSHAVVKTSKNTKHVYKINFATAVNICRAYLKHGGDETETMLLIQKHLTPVRYNRNYPIHLRPKRNRDFMYRVAQISLPLYCIMRQICNLSFCHTQKNDLNSSYICFLRISAPKKYSIS